VPRFDWHWQNWYNLEQPLALPKGTRIDCTAHFDNSPNNPEAADPTKEVTWGDQSWDEMMIGFFNLVFDASSRLTNCSSRNQRRRSRGAPVESSPWPNRARRFISRSLTRRCVGCRRRRRKKDSPVDYIRTTDPIDDAYLAAHDLFVQVNYPPYRWTPVAEAAFKKAMEQGTIGWVGFHHASLLGKFDGFEMSPFFHQFMGNIVFKSYIPDFATGTVRVEDSAHPVVKGLPAAFTIENDEWYTYDRSPRPDVHVLANVDENSYEPARSVRWAITRHLDESALQSAERVLPVRHKPDLFENSEFKSCSSMRSLGSGA
jgi:hypothetical protein